MRGLCGLLTFSLMLLLAMSAASVSADAVEVSLSPERTALAPESELVVHVRYAPPGSLSRFLQIYIHPIDEDAMGVWSLLWTWESYLPALDWEAVDSVVAEGDVLSIAVTLPPRLTRCEACVITVVDDSGNRVDSHRISISSSIPDGGDWELAGDAVIVSRPNRHDNWQIGEQYEIGVLINGFGFDATHPPRANFQARLLKGGVTAESIRLRDRAPDCLAAANRCYFDWVPGDHLEPGDDYQIEFMARGEDGTTRSDIGGEFSLRNGGLRLTLPPREDSRALAGEPEFVRHVGRTIPVRWVSPAVSGGFDIELTDRDGNRKQQIVNDVSGSAFDWTIGYQWFDTVAGGSPNPNGTLPWSPGPGYRIRVSARGDLWDESAPFTIALPRISAVSTSNPAQADERLANFYQGGDEMEITWDTRDVDPSLHVGIWLDLQYRHPAPGIACPAGPWSIARDVPATAERYSWTVGTIVEHPRLSTGYWPREACLPIAVLARIYLQEFEAVVSESSTEQAWIERR